MNLSTNADKNADTLKKPKFMFGRSFETSDMALEAMRNAPEPTVTIKVAEMEGARATSYADGVNAGRAEAAVDQNAMLLQLMERTAHSLRDLMQSSRTKQEHEAEAVAMAVKAIAQKALPRYMEQHGFAEIEQLVIDTLQQLKEEPRLVIRVADQHLDACVKHLNDVAAKAAYEGKLVVLADGNLGPSDCRIEWADGGLERLENNLWASVDQALSHRIGAHRQQVDNYTQPTQAVAEQQTEAPQAEAGEKHDN